MLKVTISLPQDGAERLIEKWNSDPEARKKLEELGITEITEIESSEIVDEEN